LIGGVWVDPCIVSRGLPGLHTIQYSFT